MLVAIGTVVGAENRIGARGAQKAESYFGGGNREAFGGPMAGAATASIGAERLKECTGQRDGLLIGIVILQQSAFVGERKKVGQSGLSTG